jgi:hypothetical protein
MTNMAGIAKAGQTSRNPLIRTQTHTHNRISANETATK